MYCFSCSKDIKKSSFHSISYLLCSSFTCSLIVLFFLQLLDNLYHFAIIFAQWFYLLLVFDIEMKSLYSRLDLYYIYHIFTVNNWEDFFLFTTVCGKWFKLIKNNFSPDHNVTIFCNATVLFSKIVLFCSLCMLYK